jgi:hypothetical protein
MDGVGAPITPESTSRGKPESQRHVTVLRLIKIWQPTVTSKASHSKMDAKQTPEPSVPLPKQPTPQRMPG